MKIDTVYEQGRIAGLKEARDFLRSTASDFRQIERQRRNIRRLPTQVEARDLFALQQKYQLLEGQAGHLDTLIEQASSQFP